MIKTIVFDVDGLIIIREKFFSQRFSHDFGVPMEEILPFFQNEFQLCVVGRADLKVELKKYLARWGWTRSVDDLLEYWFENESAVDQRVMDSVRDLRSHGISCYMATNNEKYRTRHLLEVLKLKDQFDGAFASGLLGCMKPQPEFWSVVYESVGQPTKSDVLVWDDDEENVQSARDFGFRAELYIDFGGYEVEVRKLFGGAI